MKKDEPTEHEKAQMKFSLHNAVWVAVVDFGVDMQANKSKIVSAWEAATDFHMDTGRSAYKSFIKNASSFR